MDELYSEVPDDQSNDTTDLPNMNLRLSQDDQAEFNKAAVNAGKIMAVTKNHLGNPHIQHSMTNAKLKNLKKLRSGYKKKQSELIARNLDIQKNLENDTFNGLTNDVIEQIKTIRNIGVFESNRSKIHTIIVTKNNDEITNLRFQFTPETDSNVNVVDENINFVPGASGTSESISLKDSEYLIKVTFYIFEGPVRASLAGVLLRTSHQNDDDDAKLIIATNQIKNVKERHNKQTKEFCLDYNRKSFKEHYLTNSNKINGYAQPSSNNTVDEYGKSCDKNSNWSPASIENHNENERVKNLIRREHRNRKIGGDGAWLGGIRRHENLWAGNDRQRRHYKNIVRRQNMNVKRGPGLWHWLNSSKWNYQYFRGGEPNGERHWWAHWSEPLLHMTGRGTWNDLWYGHPWWWIYRKKFRLHKMAAVFSKKSIPVQTRSLEVGYDQQIIVRDGAMVSIFRKAINTKAIELFEKLIKTILSLDTEMGTKDKQIIKEYHANQAMIEQLSDIIVEIDKQIASLDKLITSVNKMVEEKDFEESLLQIMKNDATDLDGFSNIENDYLFNMMSIIEDNTVNIVIVLIILILFYKYYNKK